MNQTRTAQDKWAQFGWKAEQRYGNKVLVGNWAEERLQFTVEPKAASSTSGSDYRPHWDHRPDVSERRSALLRAEGIPSKLLFAHHGQPSSHYPVTHYEESYGRRRAAALPAERPWHAGGAMRQRERSDQPGPAPPTNLGSLESTNYRWEMRQPALPSLTVHRSSYPKHPLSTFCQSRSARAPRSLSSHLHAANHTNKDLDLRQRSLLQVPDPRLSGRLHSQQA